MPPRARPSLGWAAARPRRSSAEPTQSPRSARCEWLAVSVAESVLDGLDADFSFGLVKAGSSCQPFDAELLRFGDSFPAIDEPPTSGPRLEADAALRKAIGSGALSPLRKTLDQYAGDASPAILAEARRFRERLRYRAKRAAKQHRKVAKEDERPPSPPPSSVGTTEANSLGSSKHGSASSLATLSSEASASTACPSEGQAHASSASHMCSPALSSCSDGLLSPPTRPSALVPMCGGCGPTDFVLSPEGAHDVDEARLLASLPEAVFCPLTGRVMADPVVT